MRCFVKLDLVVCPAVGALEVLHGSRLFPLGNAGFAEQAFTGPAHGWFPDYIEADLALQLFDYDFDIWHVSNFILVEKYHN